MTLPSTTPDNAALLDLIARLEKAQGPSRELDAAVWARVCAPADFTDFSIAAECRVEFEPNEDGSVRMYVYGPREEGPNYVGRRAAPHYSSSVDAALSLVPEGFVHHTRALNIEGTMRHEACVDYAPWREGANLALALCIASLRARAALKARCS